MRTQSWLDKGGAGSFAAISTFGTTLLKDPMLNRSSRRARRNLNELIVDSYDETLAIEEATELLRDPKRRAWLRERSVRRLSFRRDLGGGVRSLGGAPATGPSLAARCQRTLRRVRRAFAGGAHEGDAYGVCARAAEKSVLAYARSLELELPDDVRFGLERHFEEVEADRIELRRLRWGAELAFVAPVTATERASLHAGVVSDAPVRAP